MVSAATTASVIRDCERVISRRNGNSTHCESQNIFHVLVYDMNEEKMLEYLLSALACLLAFREVGV